MPSTAGGVALGAHVAPSGQPGPWALVAGYAMLPQTEGTAPYDAMSRFWRVGVHGLACPWTWVLGPSWTSSPCALVDAGVLGGSVAGPTVVRRRPRHAPWLALGALASATLNLHREGDTMGPYSLSLLGGPAFTISRHDFVLGNGARVFRVPPWYWQAGLALSRAF